MEFRSELPAGTEVDDHTCLRFLRSRKFDVEKAADLYSKDIVRFALWPVCIACFRSRQSLVCSFPSNMHLALERN